MPLVNGHYSPVNPEWLADGSPSGFRRSNLPRYLVTNDYTTLTTQVLLSAAIALQAGDTVSALTFKSGGTAAVTPTNWWVALYDDSATPALMGQSADQLTAAWAAVTSKTVSLATPKLIPRSGIYYAALMMKAATPVSLLGVAALVDAVSGFVSGDKVLAQNSGSGLTTTAPATITGGSAVGFIPRVVVT
jgi:hypothetical protein